MAAASLSSPGAVVIYGPSVVDHWDGMVMPSMTVVVGVVDVLFSIGQCVRVIFDWRVHVKYWDFLKGLLLGVSWLH